MVDPGCSGNVFDDVQNLHERRVVIVIGRAIVDERSENNTAKWCVAQSGKVRAGRH